MPRGRIEGDYIPECERAILADEKQEMIDELDAVVRYLYGLNEKQLARLFETCREGWHYENHLKAVLKHSARWGEQ